MKRVKGNSQPPLRAAGRTTDLFFPDEATRFIGNLVAGSLIWQFH